MIILGEPFLAHLIFVYPSLHLLWQSRHSLNTDAPSSADLTCFAIEKNIVAPTFETSVQLVFKDFL